MNRRQVSGRGHKRYTQAHGMKLIDRYLLREYLGAASYCLAAFCMLYVVVDLFERLPDFLAAGISLPQIAFFYLNFLLAINGPTSFFALILPITMLLGLLYALYGFSRHNELTAMRACGIGFFRLMVPFLAIGCLAAMLCLLVQETMAPSASLRVDAMVGILRGASPDETPVLQQHPFYHRQTRQQWSIGEIDPRNPRVLRDVRIVIERDDHSRARELTAKRAEWLDGSWWFFDATLRDLAENGRPLGPPRTSLRPLEKRDYTASPHDILLGARRWELFSAWQMWQFIRTHPDLSPEGRAQRLVDLHIRLAMPWVCLVVTMLGIPGGVHTHRQGALAGILSAIFFLFIFYTLLQAGIYLGKRLIIPPWAGAWFPNAVFFTTGLHMIRRLR